MEPQNDRTPPEPPQPAGPPPAPKKRFRFVKLEERIAPQKGGNGTHNGCGGSSNSGSGTSSSSIY
jgi:hypothetical protein